MRVRSIEKPWGYELLVTCTERYAGKILVIHAGHRLSLHQHRRKDETLLLLSGVAELEVEESSGVMSPYRMELDEVYRIFPGRLHRITALEDTRVLEISTPDLEDVIRFEDDYGRTPNHSTTSRGVT